LATPEKSCNDKSGDAVKKTELQIEIIMPKRKRDGRLVGQNTLSEEDHKRADLERQIQLGKRQLTRNLKLAKGFERQKLGRREKEARAKKDTNEITKIEAEIQALKVRPRDPHAFLF
jgi:hypothetical protein